ncbi:growth hormone releasing hormone receptor 2 [Centropristis striata]|uniref:growth hormone releasing hormone receptor 2 n=1 Tax=Centropristis striata TaxID=184440 RepID=UPI0027E0AEB8|nr:growth hormone releasing hormone receptor 2 [Centropristis striata]
MNLSLTAAVYILIFSQNTARSSHPECSIVFQLQKKENECKVKMKTESEASLQNTNETAGCETQWDGVSCWPASSEGQTVSVLCPLLLKPQTPPVVITRSCTLGGWSELSEPYHEACFSEAPEEDEAVSREKNFFATVKLMYSVGYAASLAALLLAALIFCCFRKLLCTRNYIHLNLFLTFMLRSVAVFVKDAVLFADKSTDHCTVSTLVCKAAVTFFHFCVLCNFCWLLVEALHLQTLLLCSFTHSRNIFWVYVAVGWGAPAVTVVVWALLKARLNDQGCWDDLDSSLWWIIKVPILLSIFINFLIFLNISRIIVQKTKDTRVNQRETHLYRTLLRSTLLLVPLFGIHFMVFALIPEHVGVGARLCFELVLGSFQGFIVALLYCFLNGEVQREIRRTLRRFWPKTKTNDVNLPTQEILP